MKIPEKLDPASLNRTEHLPITEDMVDRAMAASADVVDLMGTAKINCEATQQPRRA